MAITPINSPLAISGSPSHEIRSGSASEGKRRSLRTSGTLIGRPEVAISPNNGSFRLKLGDAYYSALRYRDALAQYEKAKELGEGKAAQRIEKVKVKLGE